MSRDTYLEDERQVVLEFRRHDLVSFRPRNIIVWIARYNLTHFLETEWALTDFWLNASFDYYFTIENVQNQYETFLRVGEPAYIYHFPVKLDVHLVPLFLLTVSFVLLLPHIFHVMHLPFLHHVQLVLFTKVHWSLSPMPRSDNLSIPAYYSRRFCPLDHPRVYLSSSYIGRIYPMTVVSTESRRYL